VLVVIGKYSVFLAPLGLFLQFRIGCSPFLVRCDVSFLGKPPPPLPDVLFPLCPYTSVGCFLIIHRNFYVFRSFHCFRSQPLCTFTATPSRYVFVLFSPTVSVVGLRFVFLRVFFSDLSSDDSPFSLSVSMVDHAVWCSFFYDFSC